MNVILIKCNNIFIRVRNGSNLLMAIYNYQRHPSFIQIFRDNDIRAVQIGMILWDDSAQFLLFARNVFEIDAANKKYTPAIHSALIVGFLRVFVQLMTFLPFDPTSALLDLTADLQQSVENIVLRRTIHMELLHLLMGGITVLKDLRTGLENVLSFRDESFPEELFKETLIQLCGSSAQKALGKGINNSSSTNVHLSLQNPKDSLLFNPVHVHFSEEQEQCAAESSRHFRKLLKKSEPESCFPYCDRDALKYVHASFIPCRFILYDPSFADTLSSFVESISGKMKSAETTIIGHVVHLLTIQLHCFQECIHYADLNNIQGVNSYKSVDQFSLALNDESSSIVRLVSILARIYSQNILSDEELISDGLTFILKEFAKLSSYIRNTIFSGTNIVNSEVLKEGGGLAQLETDRPSSNEEARSSSDLVKSEDHRLRSTEAKARALRKILNAALSFCHFTKIPIPPALLEATGKSAEPSGSQSKAKITADTSESEINCILCG